VSQLLYGIRTRMELLAPRLANEDLRRALVEIVALVARANLDIRRMTFDLHPPVLQESGLESALAWLAGEFSAQYKIRARSTPRQQRCRSPRRRHDPLPRGA